MLCRHGTDQALACQYHRYDNKLKKQTKANQNGGNPGFFVPSVGCLQRMGVTSYLDGCKTVARPTVSLELFWMVCNGLETVSPNCFVFTLSLAS
jgi:hypothetical protein